MYYASVRAVDSEGNKGPISTGDGWLVGGLLLQDITDQTVNENSAITAVDAADLSGGDTDVDSNPITYSCYVDNTNNDSVADRNSCTTITGMGFNTATGELTWTPGAGQGGSYEVKIDATSASSQDEKVFTIVVNGSFVTEWQTDNTGSSNSDQITLPLIYNGSYNFVVDWGDGSSDDTITAYDDAAATHTFQGGAGLYTVTITGEIEGWSFGNGGTDAAKLTRITHWGNFKFGDSDFQFHGAQNLVITATGWPELTSTSSLMVAFGDCDSLTAIPGLASWDVSDISNMSYLFWDSSTFDQDISNWDVSAATDMQSMFQNATNFDQDIGSWDVSKVTNMTDIFDGVTLSTVNYDALLVGWSTQDAGEPNPPVQPSVTFSGGNSVTSGTGAAAKTVLEAAPNLWTISDGD